MSYYVFMANMIKATFRFPCHIRGGNSSWFHITPAFYLAKSFLLEYHCQCRIPSENTITGGSTAHLWWPMGLDILFILDGSVSLSLYILISFSFSVILFFDYYEGVSFQREIGVAIVNKSTVDITRISLTSSPTMSYKVSTSLLNTLY